MEQNTLKIEFTIKRSVTVALVTALLILAVYEVLAWVFPQTNQFLSSSRLYFIVAAVIALFLLGQLLEILRINRGHKRLKQSKAEALGVRRNLAMKFEPEIQSKRRELNRLIHPEVPPPRSASDLDEFKAAYRGRRSSDLRQPFEGGQGGSSTITSSKDYKIDWATVEHEDTGLGKYGPEDGTAYKGNGTRDLELHEHARKRLMWALETLGLSEEDVLNTSLREEDISKLYRLRSNLYHPDKFQKKDEKRKKWATRKMSELNEAKIIIFKAISGDDIA